MDRCVNREEIPLTIKVIVVMSACFLGLGARAQDSAPARYISPLECVYQGRIDSRNIVEQGGMKFKVSQKGHDDYNRFSISKTTEISGVKVGSFAFKSSPTREDCANGAYSKKLHFDIYDYGNLNGNKDKELIRAGDTLYVTFLVQFVTPPPNPEPGSPFDDGNIKYKRNLFYQFWPGGVATHFTSYPHESPEEKAGAFGYVTVMTGDYGDNKPTLSRKFEVEKDRWYRMSFLYNPDVSHGRILAKMSPHRQGLLTEEMTTLIDLRGNTLYETKSNRRILPTFGNYHFGECPTSVETRFTEILASKEPLHAHFLLPGRKENRNRTSE